MVYGDRRANPTGRLPDDTWILRPQDLPDGFQADEDTWYFPRVCGTFKERAGWHGCQMPEQLLGRIIRACSNEGELVLDPFAGSGTTLAVAKKLGRRFLGFELSEQYADRSKAAARRRSSPAIRWTARPSRSPRARDHRGRAAAGRRGPPRRPPPQTNRRRRRAASATAFEEHRGTGSRHSTL